MSFSHIPRDPTTLPSSVTNVSVSVSHVCSTTFLLLIWFARSLVLSLSRAESEPGTRLSSHTCAGIAHVVPERGPVSTHRLASDAARCERQRTAQPGCARELAPSGLRGVAHRQRQPCDERCQAEAHRRSESFTDASSLFADRQATTRGRRSR